MVNPTDPRTPREGTNAGDPTPGTLRLRPRRAVAGAWTAAGLGLLGMGAWIVADSRGAPLSWAALVVFALVVTYFATQLVVPGRFVVVLHPDRLEARMPWRHVELPWDAVHLARVTHRLGEPWLVIDVRPEADETGGDREQVGILLPVGVDLAALHGWLAQRLGRGSETASA